MAKPERLSLKSLINLMKSSLPDDVKSGGIAVPQKLTILKNYEELELIFRLVLFL